MLTSAPIVTYVITGESAKILRAAKALARKRISPDHADSDAGRTFPNGIEKRFERRYRVGDYFENVEIVDDADASAFRLVFHVRDSADGYWKDVLVKIICAIRDVGATVKPVKSLA